MNQSKTIRLPAHLIDKISRIRKATLALTEELGREPTDEELSYYLEIPVNKIAHFKSVSTRPASLNAPVSEDSQGTEFGDLVGDESARSPFEQLNEKSARSELSEMFERLEHRESEIIRLRFGIERDSPLTLEEVGSIFGITRERVRQLQNIALQKMRRIMASHEHQFSLEELKQIQRKTRADERSERVLSENPDRAEHGIITAIRQKLRLHSIDHFRIGTLYRIHHFDQLFVAGTNTDFIVICFQTVPS